ncbi:MAG: hypothetical protein K2G45_01365 [Lachnospiraceae bacterium]|nr:hypothetical protein [Lachnospiraceae bacterium]
MGTLFDRNKKVLAVFNNGKINIPNSMWGQDIAEYNRIENGLRVVKNINSGEVYGYVDEKGCFYDIYKKKLGKINSYHHSITDDLGHFNYSDGMLGTYDGSDMVGAAAAAIVFFDKLNDALDEKKQKRDALTNITDTSSKGSNSYSQPSTFIDYFNDFMMVYIFIPAWIELIVTHQRKANMKDCVFTLIYFLESVIFVVLYNNLCKDDVPLAVSVVTGIVVVISMFNHLRISVENYNVREIFKDGILGIVHTALRFLGVFFELYGIYYIILLFGYISGNN